MSANKVSGGYRALLLAAGVAMVCEAQAQRSACWQTQTSQILAHTTEQTSGVFELSGLARALPAAREVLRFQCSGTFLLTSGDKHYHYVCDVHDEAGDKFALQNSERDFGATQYIDGGGTGKYAALSGAALEYAQFPVNADGSLPSCDSKQSAFRLP